MIPPFRPMMHKRDHLPLNRRGEKRSAYNWFPGGIWYTESTTPWTMAQEKAEYYLQEASWMVALALLLLLPPYWCLVAAIPLVLYPGAYMVGYPGSVHVRRAVELWSHGIELRRRFRDVDRAYHDSPIHREAVKRAIISSEAYGMANHKAYNLRMGWEQIRDHYLRRIDVMS